MENQELGFGKLRIAPSGSANVVKILLETLVENMAELLPRRFPASILKKLQEEPYACSIDASDNKTGPNH